MRFRLAASSGVTLAMLSASACSAFGVSPNETPSSDASAAETPDATGPSGDGGPPNDASDCDGGCVLFRDDFERTGGVQGPWTASVGEQSLSLVPGPRGMALRARQEAATGSDFREALLSVALPPRSGLRVSLRIEDLSADAAKFGPDSLHYCELVGVSLGEERIAIVYYSRPTDLDVWLYGPDEMNGDTTAIDAPSTGGADVDLTLEWGSDAVTVNATIAGKSGTATQPLKPELAKATPTVNVGLRCKNMTGAISVTIDDVVVRALP